jgi:hypothetical protein
MPQPSILILGVPLTDIAVCGEAFMMLEGVARRERYQLSSRTPRYTGLEWTTRRGSGGGLVLPWHCLLLYFV